jgi:protein-L-isoaspartate O-methyltransferase
VTRAGLVGEWMDSLRLKRDDRVLEVGSGPGYVTLVLADRVGPSGIIYAVDRSVEALAYLGRLQKERVALTFSDLPPMPRRSNRQA